MNLQRRDFFLAVTLATAVATPALAQTVTSGVATASGATSAASIRVRGPRGPVVSQYKGARSGPTHSRGLVLRNTDMTKLAQVQAARTAGTEPVQEGQDIHGHKVLSAYAPVSPLGWLVFVELPAEEAYASLYDSIKRSGAIIFTGLALRLDQIVKETIYGRD